jgi:hypothetical protein
MTSSVSKVHFAFEEAFDVLVEKCVEADQRLYGVNVIHSPNMRNDAYGCDIWIGRIVPDVLNTKSMLLDEDYAPFYEAAWEMCRMGILRPGPYAPKGLQISGTALETDGYSITTIGRAWLRDPERRPYGDPGRMTTLLAPFEPLFGSGFLQRSVEAVHCHRAGHHLAACAMAGAAAESILLAVAIGKTKDEGLILKEYARSGGRRKVTDIVTGELKPYLQRQFTAGLDLLNYWRDAAAHGKSTAISEVEAFMSLAQLLRWAHFCSDSWNDLTT